jgi:class 3 adenylate cyclase
MGLKDDLEKDVDNIISKEWSIREGQVVPKTEDVALAGGAVSLDATILYADLADSTILAMDYDRRVAAKVIKSFLTCSSKIIRACSGEIRSFDGDRVMGVFVGDSKNSLAAECALKINYAVLKIIKPKLEAKYSNLKSGAYRIAHCSGIDTSEVLIVRGGVRNNNDLVWVGRSPNVAAKLSGIRDSPYHSYITKAVFDRLNEKSKFGGTNKELMWKSTTWSEVKGVNTVYKSAWTWAP